MPLRLTVLLAAALSSVALLSWAQTPQKDPQAAAPLGQAARAARPPGMAPAGAKTPPTAVSVLAVALSDVPRTLTATGYTVALQSVAVRAQVSALVQRVHVQEGQSVKAGQLLFTLDDSVARAELAKAQATLARTQAQLIELQRQHKRSQALQAQAFVSPSATDNLAAQVQAQQAQLGADGAALRAQELRVALYRIAAPFAGRVGAINVFAGSLVGSETLLTLTQMQPMGVQFAVPQASLPAVARAGLGAAVLVQTPPQTSAPRPGRLRFIDNQVNPATGMLTLKAQIDNRDQSLWPGTSVQVSLHAQALQQVALLPQAAVILREGKPTVWLVDADNKATSRPVQTLETVGERVAVRGLQTGDRVVVDGRQFVRSGAPVRVVGQALE